MAYPDILRILAESGITPEPIAQAPGPPAFAVPNLVSAPVHGFRDRVATALAGQPDYRPLPYESGGSRFGRGLIAGAARGYSSAGLLDMKQREQDAATQSAADKTAADRTNAIRTAEWQAKLTDHYKALADARGRVLVTAQHAKDSGLPVGSLVEPAQLASATAQRLTMLRGDRAQAETERHNKAMESAARSKSTSTASGGAFGQPGVDDVANQIADAIVSGQQPPEMKGLYRYGGPVRAALAARGYDMTKANADWQAVQKWVATANGSQQVRMRQAANTAYESLDVVDELSATLSKQIPRGSVKVLNRAAVVLAQNGAFGPEAQSTATNLVAQITDITSELGNVYMGGNSPTDHALKLAQQNLSGDWSEKQLRDATALARTNLRIRLNSMSAIKPTTADIPGHAAGQGGAGVKFRRTAGGPIKMITDPAAIQALRSDARFKEVP